MRGTGQSNLTVKQETTADKSMTTPNKSSNKTQNMSPQNSKKKKSPDRSPFAKTTTKKIKMGPERPLYPVPNMKDGMGAHYTGLYAKTFFASSLNGDYRSKSTIARKHEHKTREDNNMLGMTDKYD